MSTFLTNSVTGYAQVLEELNGATITRKYTYGLSLISENQPVGGTATISFYGFDGHGSVRQLTDRFGNVTDTYTYDAFGNLLTTTGSTPNNYKFAGEQFDPDLGLYYNRARYLDVRQGRFWGMDTAIGFLTTPSSLHRYLYVSDNPVNSFDPTGLEETTVLGQRFGFADYLIVTAMAVISLAYLCTATANIGGCKFERSRESDRQFYRGTTYYEGLDLMDMPEIDRFTNAPGGQNYDYGPGLYMTPQLAVAQYFASYNARFRPANGGPMIFFITIKESKWERFLAQGAREGPISNFAEIPGATQAFVPPNLIGEFVTAARIIPLPEPR